MYICTCESLIFVYTYIHRYIHIHIPTHIHIYIFTKFLSGITLNHFSFYPYLAHWRLTSKRKSLFFFPSLPNFITISWTFLPHNIFFLRVPKKKILSKFSSQNSLKILLKFSSQKFIESPFKMFLPKIPFQIFLPKIPFQIFLPKIPFIKTLHLSNGLLVSALGVTGVGAWCCVASSVPNTTVLPLLFSEPPCGAHPYL